MMLEITVRGLPGLTCVNIITAACRLVSRSVLSDDEGDDTDNFTVEEDVPPNSTAVSMANMFYPW